MKWPKLFKKSVGECVARKLSQSEWDAAKDKVSKVVARRLEEGVETLLEMRRLEARFMVDEECPPGFIFADPSVHRISPSSSPFWKATKRPHPPEGYPPPSPEVHRYRYPVRLPRDHRMMAEYAARDALPPPASSYADHELIYVEGEREVRLVTPEGDFRIPIDALQQVLMNELLDGLGE